MNSLETQVLRLIGESTSSPDVFKDTDEAISPIRTSLNDAIQEITMLTGGHQETIHVPLVSGKTFYRLTAHTGYLGWVTEAWLVNEQRRLHQTDLHQLNLENPRWLVHESRPDKYFQVALDIVGFAPKPSASSDIVALEIVMIPVAYTTDTARIKLRDMYRWAAVSYAVSEYYASRGDANEALTHLDRYLKVLGLRREYQEARDRQPRLRTDKEPSDYTGRYL